MKGHLYLLAGLLSLASAAVPNTASASERSFQISNDQFMRDGKPFRLLSGGAKLKGGRTLAP